MKILSRHVALIAVLAPLSLSPLSGSASVFASAGAVTGEIGQGYQSATTDPKIVSVGGATASLQFRSTSNCLGAACRVDGPALGAYLTGGGQGDFARANLQYTVTVSGGPELVPILFSGAYETLDPDVLPRGAGGTNAGSSINANVVNGLSLASRYRFRSDCFNYPPEFEERGPEMNCGAGTFTGMVTMTENSTLQVSMSAFVFRSREDRFLGPASAYIDPFFQIDPVFASTHPGYMLAFDPGVGNGAPTPQDFSVPEPGGFALVAAGLAGIVGLRRRSISDKRSFPDAVS